METHDQQVESTNACTDAFSLKDLDLDDIRVLSLEQEETVGIPEMSASVGAELCCTYCSTK